MVKVLETTSTTVTAAGRRCAGADYFTFATGTGNYLDDVVVLKLDGDTVKTETQAYNAANEMTSQVADGATTNFAYDQYGRMTAKTRGGYTGTFYYNYGDKLTKAASNFQGEGTVTYSYSGDQKRRSRSVTGGAMTKYRVDQGFGVVNEENSGGTLLSTYIHHPGRQIGTVLATSEGSTASSGTYAYYFQDAIGSTRSLWDEDGDRRGKYDYTPFGGKYGNTGEEITRKFTGHDWDNEARLYHTAYRQYSPDTGRWLTRDPLGMVDGPNVYAYVKNNPVRFTDPKGLCSLVDSDSSLIEKYPAEILLGITCVLSIALLVGSLASAFGAYSTVGPPFWACATCIVAAVVAYLLLDFDPTTSPGIAIAGLMGGVCGAACVVAFLTIEIIAVPILSFEYMLSGALLRTSAGLLGVAGGALEGVGCGATASMFLAAVR